MKKLFLFFALIAALELSAQTTTTVDIRALPSHPRLILRGGDVAAMRDAIERVPQMERLFDEVLKTADRAIEQPVSERKKEGKRLLGVSRQVLERVLNCAIAYKLTDDEEYLRRAESEMVAAAGFSDWNPSHFLDVGEMTAALALGYDWLYDKLSEDSRRRIEDAIIAKGLLGAEKESQMWFYRRENNWNQVCNAGLVLGALAVAEREPELAAQVVAKSLTSNRLGLKPYAPEGAYPEGYGYWSYGTWYQVLMIEALRTAVGDDYALDEAAGFKQSAYFMNYMVAPSGRPFNYSDCSVSRRAHNLLLAWFAVECNDMSLIGCEMESLKSAGLRVMERRFLPLGLLFMSRCVLSNVAPMKGNFWYGRGEQPLFVYRGGWHSSDDVYLAAKGGSASTSHAHMDAGSFVYEWGGVRWSCDLGAQNYYSLESKGVKLWNMAQESQRWEVFRLGNMAHSTLSVEGERHLCKGFAEMTEVFESEDCHGATFDMTSVLNGMRRAERTITIGCDAAVMVTDRVEAEERCLLRWVMCTPAKATIEGKGSILLESNGRKLRVELVAPHRKVKPFILSNDPTHDYDAPNKGTCRVGFVLDLGANRPTALQVRLTPLV